MKALVDLAMAVQDGERTQDVSPLVKQALEQFKTEREAEASTEIVELVRKIEQYKITHRDAIRKLKVQIKALVSDLETLDLRWAYAQQSNNFLPVLAFFEMVHRTDLLNPADFDKLTAVPSEFKVTDPK